MLEEQIRTRFEKHIKHGGLITAPETLLAAVLKEVARWLRTQERAYRTAGNLKEADALCNLRSNQLKKD